MNIVKFTDGRYGVRRLTLEGYQYLDLENNNYWYPYNMKRHIYTYCAVPTYEKAYASREKLFYKSKKYELLEYKFWIMLPRMIGLLCFVITSELGLDAMSKEKASINVIIILILYTACLYPAILLLIRGFLIEEHVTFINDGWDK